MKCDHAIKHNGAWYKAGEEIPECDSLVSSDFMNPPIYTKTEINRMSTADLQTLAMEQGIDNAFEITGAELKKLLIEKLGL